MSADTNPGKDGQKGTVIQTTVSKDAHTLVVNQKFSPAEAKAAEVISPGLSAVENEIRNISGEYGCIYFSGSVDKDGKIVIVIPQG